MREICMSGSTGGEWKRLAGGYVRRDARKYEVGPLTTPYPPRHSSTLLAIRWAGRRGR